VNDCRNWIADARGLVRGPFGTRANRMVRLIGRPIYEISHRPLILGREHADRAGGYLLAPNHHHAMDIPSLMYACPRLVEFVSTVQVMTTPGVGWFYRWFRPIPLNRGVVDPRSVREIVQRLRAGRVVGIFPEAQIRPEAKSITSGGPHRAGFGRIARLADVPVIPTVVLDSRKSMTPSAWLPLAKTRFAVAFGEPLFVRPDLEPRDAQKELEERWRESIHQLMVRLDRSEQTGV
jgi:1-acyl-sn-glycerol-3-phosphate acyltransferase